MTRFDLMVNSGVIKEYKPMNWRRRRALSRRIDHALRYVCPPDATFTVLLETVFWLLLAGACAAGVLAVPVLFVRWWLCM